METSFIEIVQLIKQSQKEAIKSVNAELINLYWKIGQYLCHQLANANWGDKTVDELALFIQQNNPELKGFNRRGLYRMKQFYETYAGTMEGRISSADNDTISLVSIVSSPMTQLKQTDIRKSNLAKVSWGCL